MNNMIVVIVIALWLTISLAWAFDVSAHIPNMGAAMNSYGWGNSPHWLAVVCKDRTDCWT